MRSLAYLALPEIANFNLKAGYVGCVAWQSRGVSSSLVFFRWAFGDAPGRTWDLGGTPFLVSASGGGLRGEKRCGTDDVPMQTNSNWSEAIFDDKRASSAIDLVVRAVSEYDGGRKVLCEKIYFEGVHVFRSYKGSFRFSFSDHDSVVLDQNETIVVYPRRYVTIAAMGSSNRLVYGIFTGVSAEAYFDSLGFFDCAKGATASHYENIRELRSRLESCPTAMADNACRARLTDILVTELSEMKSSGSAVVYDAIKCMRANIRRKVLHLEPVCAALGVSRVHLYNEFKSQNMGSPSEYMRKEQMRYVLELMAERDLNLGEIASRAGFLSLSHFSHFIKSRTGRTPRQLRHSRGNPKA